MGVRQSLLLLDDELAEIQKETGFTANQIEKLYNRFTALDKTSSGALSKEDFLQIPELAINPLAERIVLAFFRNTEDNRVNFRQFVRVLAHFRPVKKNKENQFNSRDGKLKFAFKLYDLDNDDKITKEELVAVLQMMVGENVSEDQLISIAERTILESDMDGDGMIGFEEFCQSLERSEVEEKMSLRFLSQ